MPLCENTKTSVLQNTTQIKYLTLNHKEHLRFLFYKFSGIRARNNFLIVSGHDDRPNSFLLGHVSFLASQMYMMNYSFRGP